MVDPDGDRAITVIGDRLQPRASDPLPWSELQNCDAVFVTAADPAALRACRSARVMTATPRVRLNTLREAAIQLDALIGSGLILESSCRIRSDFPALDCRSPRKGRWGLVVPGGHYDATPAPGPCVDSYGCGDSFAAGVTVGLAAGWRIRTPYAWGLRPAPPAAPGSALSRCC